MKDYIYIIENAKPIVLAGLYYQHYGIIGLDDFMRSYHTYKGLPISAKETSKAINSLTDKIKEIKDSYPHLEINTFKKDILLMTIVTEKINTDLQSDSPKAKKKLNKIIIKKQKKARDSNVYFKNIRFQKDSLINIDLDFYRYFITFLNDEPYISFTQDKISGVTYTLSFSNDGGCSSNLSKLNQEKLECGEYIIDTDIVHKNDKQELFYKLEKI